MWTCLCISKETNVSVLPLILFRCILELPYSYPLFLGLYEDLSCWRLVFWIFISISLLVYGAVQTSHINSKQSEMLCAICRLECLKKLCYMAGLNLTNSTGLDMYSSNSSCESILDFRPALYCPVLSTFQD